MSKDTLGIDSRVDLTDLDQIQGQYSSLLERVSEKSIEKLQFEQIMAVLKEARGLNVERKQSSPTAPHSLTALPGGKTSSPFKL
jgi:hypothetical protein